MWAKFSQTNSFIGHLSCEEYMTMMQLQENLQFQFYKVIFNFIPKNNSTKKKK